MKRLLFACFFVISCFFINVFNINAVHAGTQDFIISNFQADYYLGRDGEGRSTLKTIESITAVFPNYDQNHGIERALPKTYNGHSVSLRIQSITDENGINQRYSEYHSNGNLVLRIGDADTYVHGQKTYIITYTQRDITKYFFDTGDDEFYWDVNGNGWLQPFSQVSVTVHIDSSLVSKLNGKQSCYYGDYGSNNTCNLSLDNNKEQITASVNNLSIGQTMTIAIGFLPHTFSPYQMTKAELFVQKTSIPLAFFCYILLALTLYLRIFLYRDASRRQAIIAEYVPPKDIDLSTSAAILRRADRIFQASIISLAVNHHAKITETISDFILGIKIKKYNIELISTEGMTANDREVAMILFGAGLTPGKGSSVDFPKTDTKLVERVGKYISAIKRDLKEDGYLANKKMIFITIALLSLVLLLLSVYVIGVLPSGHALLAVGIYLNIFICPIIIISLLNKKPLNAKGRELYDYLLGLKLFIKTAEQDRIKFLQSPRGSEKTMIDINNKKAVVKLYEKLLPYAILFGLEKEWSKELAVYYSNQNTSPVWYAGAAGFSASSFSSSLSSFSSSLSSSSSSGGSGGGGSSGGGGGGGGGGGW